MKDFLDKTLLPGDEVIVAHRVGSSCWLVKKRVLSIADDGRPVLTKEGGGSYKYGGSSGGIFKIPRQRDTYTCEP